MSRLLDDKLRSKLNEEDLFATETYYQKNIQRS